MARNRDPFTQALASLRERIQSGVLAGGRPVIVQDEAERLRLSTTPIREALARLSGEGLVERASSGGYVTLRLDAAAVRDRYAMQAYYVRIALELNLEALGSTGPPQPLRVGEETPATAVRRLFSGLVCSAGNALLWDGFQKVGGQLDLFRRLEPRLFPDLGGEAAALFAAYADIAGEAFEEAICRYHRRRMAAAGALAALLKMHRANDETLSAPSPPAGRGPAPGRSDRHDGAP